jgi:hypothetical protein
MQILFFVLVFFAFSLGILFGIKIQYYFSEYVRTKARTEWAGHKEIRKVKSENEGTIMEDSTVHEPLKLDVCEK